VIGYVDGQLRAQIDVSISPTKTGIAESVEVWIDIAFNGGLVLPREAIARLGLKTASSTDAILADGQRVELASFTCFLDWFGQRYRTQVIANDGEFPLLGTVLLSNRRLLIDYATKSVNLD
jgi:clan AA aspartic protease